MNRLSLPSSLCSPGASRRAVSWPVAALVGLSIACMGLTGCSLFRRTPQAPPPPRTEPDPQLVKADGAYIELVPFRPGVSSATVESMAKATGCTGGKGAGLLTEPGPVEVYRMVCENGKVFQARCEMRQCKAM